MALIAGALLVGAASQIQSNQQEAAATRRQARQRRAMQEEQIIEINSAAQRQIAHSDRVANVFRGQQTAGYAAAGVDVGAGSALIVMEDTARQFAEQITDTRREAAFRTKMIRKGMEFEQAAVKDHLGALKINSIGAVLGAGFKLADMYDPAPSNPWEGFDPESRESDFVGSSIPGYRRQGQM